MAKFSLMQQPTLNLPVTLERLTPEEITWLAAKSAQSGVSTSEVVRDAFRKEAKRCMPRPESPAVMDAKMDRTHSEGLGPEASNGLPI